MSWDKLEEAYKSRGLVLVLGAGVSMASGLPSWIDLLKRIADEFFAEDGDVLVDELRKDGYSLTFIASLLKSINPEPKAKPFIEVIREKLYRDFEYFSIDINKKNHTDFFRYMYRKNKTLSAVGSMCVERIKVGKTQRFIANPHIHAIVNFNLDALLQAYVVARFGKRLVLTVEHPSAGLKPGQWNKSGVYDRRIRIYHMHGYLRFDSKRGDPAKESRKLVLTEHDYFDFFNRPNTLFNYTFLYLLREYPCLFIGLSMTDDNIRRLLYYSMEEGKEGTGKKAKAVRHFAIFKRFEEESLNWITEKTLLDLGTQVLWVDDFAEIPERLGNMYVSTGKNDWESVF
jgi:hypothetical protein